MFTNMIHPLIDGLVLPVEFIRVKRENKVRLFILMELTGSFSVTVGHNVTCSPFVYSAIILLQVDFIGLFWIHCIGRISIGQPIHSWVGSLWQCISPQSNHLCLREQLALLPNREGCSGL